jgi:hypothetical protein
VVRGLHAGQRSTRGSWRGMRLQMTADAKVADDEGQTMRDRAEERGLSRHLGHSERPMVAQDRGPLVQDARRIAEWLPERTQAGWQRVQRENQGWRADVDANAGGATNPIRRDTTVVPTPRRATTSEIASPGGAEPHGSAAHRVPRSPGGSARRRADGAA